MSRYNVEQTKLAYEAFKFGLETGDFDRFEAFVHPDFEWHVAQDLEATTGLEGMKAALVGWDESWDWWTIEGEEFIDAGDSVIIVQRTRGRAAQSGVEVDGRYYNVCEIREGKLARMRQYAERGEALEHAGLSENPGFLERVRLALRRRG